MTYGFIYTSKNGKILSVRCYFSVSNLESHGLKTLNNGVQSLVHLLSQVWRVTVRVCVCGWWWWGVICDIIVAHNLKTCCHNKHLASFMELIIISETECGLGENRQGRKRFTFLS